MPVILPGLEVAIYIMIALPPFDTGGVKATLAWALPPVATPIVGAPGTPIGITLLEAADVAPTPLALVAITVNE
jgi:hypothetical protein